MRWIWSDGLFILAWNDFLFLMLNFLISLIKKMVLWSARFAVYVFVHLILLVWQSHVDVWCASWAVEAGEFAHAWDFRAFAGKVLLKIIIFLNFEICCTWNSWLLLDKRHFAYCEDLLSQIRLLIRLIRLCLTQHLFLLLDQRRHPFLTLLCSSPWSLLTDWPLPLSALSSGQIFCWFFSLSNAFLWIFWTFRSLFFGRHLHLCLLWFLMLWHLLARNPTAQSTFAGSSLDRIRNSNQITRR